MIVTPGGRGAGMVALDKMTGKTVWVSKELSDGAGYASPIVADVQGVRTVMTFTAEAGVGVRASDGKLMWRNSPAANGTANIATPVFFGRQGVLHLVATAPARPCSGCEPQAARFARRRSTSRATCRTTTAAWCW